MTSSIENVRSNGMNVRRPEHVCNHGSFGSCVTTRDQKWSQERPRPKGGCRIGFVTLYDELRQVLDALDRATVDYALVGGLAVAIWGAPRATREHRFTGTARIL